MCDVRRYSGTRWLRFVCARGGLELRIAEDRFGPLDFTFDRLATCQVQEGKARVDVIDTWGLWKTFPIDAISDMVASVAFTA